LHDRLAAVGARLIVTTLRALERDDVTPSAQPAAGVTYAAKIDRGERPVDWSAPAAAIDRKVRALSPAPGATASWRGAALRIVSAGQHASKTQEALPGTVVAVSASGIDVACGGDTVLRLIELQPGGGRAMTAAAFAAGRAVVPGARFDAVAGQRKPFDAR